jgi:hypothetical protein
LYKSQHGVARKLHLSSVEAALVRERLVAGEAGVVRRRKVVRCARLRWTGRSTCGNISRRYNLIFGRVIMAVPPYGTAINQALANARTKLEYLKVLRDHAATTLALQGDLKGALRKLEKEIKTRERGLKTAKKK